MGEDTKRLTIVEEVEKLRSAKACAVHGDEECPDHEPHECGALDHAADCDECATAILSAITVLAPEPVTDEDVAVATETWDSSTDMCSRCEGNGVLSADFRRHSQSEWAAGKVATRACDECGGSGLTDLRMRAVLETDRLRVMERAGVNRG